MKNFIKFIFFIFLIFTLPNSGWSQDIFYNHPELDWFTIKTDHFQIHYHNGAEYTAKKVAQIAESIYGPVTELYSYNKNKIIHLIIRDHDDYSNGVAYYYDDKVEIWAPAMDFDLRGTHPWLLNVVSHEFTHMVSLDKTKKFGKNIPGIYLQYWGYENETRPDVLRGFPNRIVSFPIAGSAIPPWFAEGLAQFQSPDISYDFWDTHRDMILRMAVLKNKMFSFNTMSSFGHNSLGNEMVYNSGFSLVNYISKFYGPNSLDKLTSSMKSPLRFSFSSAMKSVLKKSGQEIYFEWRNYLQKTYSEAILDIQNNIVQGRILEPDGFGNFFPVWSPEKNSIAYLSNKNQDFLGLTSLILYDLDTKKRKVIKSGVQTAIDFSPDGKKLVYAKRKKANHYGSKYFELFWYDLQSKKEKRLTFGARAKNPAWSKDGSSIVCVIGKDGTDNLAIYSMDTGSIKKITSFENGQQIFHPSFSPDGQTIVFDIATGHGRNLAVVNPDGNNFSYLIKENNDARTPVFHPVKPVIYFAWDKSGIFNIYKYDLETKTTKPLTNVLGGAFSPSFSPDFGLVYSLYNENGYKIFYIEELQDVTNNIYATQNLLIRSKPVVSDDLLKTADFSNNNNENNSSLKNENFSSKPYKSVYGSVKFLPRVIMDYGKLKLGTYLYSSEVLEKYRIFGGFAINKDMDMDIFGIIEYNKFFPTIFLEVYNQVQHTTQGFDKFKYNLLEADIGLQSTFFGEQNIFRTMFVYSRYDGRIETSSGGQKFKFGYTYMLGKSFTFLWRHNMVKLAKDMSINPSGGRKFELRYDRQYNKFIDGFELNSQYGTFVETYIPYNYNQLSLNYEEYFSLPWKHTLTLKFNGGYIDRRIDSFFNYFAGGILGMKGYPYYSIEGRKLLFSTLEYRFKISDNLNFKLLPVKFDKLYGALFFDFGNAWDQGKPQWDQFKRDVGLQLRLDTFSFYNFPTKLFFDAAYGLDKVFNQGQSYGREWRFYFGLAFDYID